MNSHPGHLINMVEVSGICSAANGSVTILSPGNGAIVDPEFDANGEFSGLVKRVDTCDVEGHAGTVSNGPGTWTADFTMTPLGDGQALVARGGGNSAMVCINVRNLPGPTSEGWDARLFGLNICSDLEECDKKRAALTEGKDVKVANFRVEVPHRANLEVLSLGLIYRHSGQPRFRIGGPIMRPRKVEACGLVGGPDAVHIENEVDRWLGIRMWWAEFRNFDSGTFVLRCADDLGGTDQIRMKIEIGQ